MTVTSFFGCGLVAYGPIFSIFFGHVGRHAYLVFLALNSSFLWLVAILLSSGAWYLLPKNASFLWTLLISVVFQQGSRVLAFYVTRLSENRMGKQNPTLLKRLDHALANGVGFGTMYALLFYISQLSETVGYGIIPSSTCPGLDLYFTSAITTMLFSLVNIILTICTFESLSRQNPWLFVFALVSHYLLSGSTFFLSTISNSCGYLFILLSGYLIVTTGCIAWPIHSLFIKKPAA